MHIKYRISDFKIKVCNVLNSTAIASAMRVVIHKKGLAMEAFFSNFSFMLQSMVKILLLVLKKKRKINYN